MDEFISVGGAKDRRSLKKLLNDSRLKNVQIQIKDVLEGRSKSDKEYLKTRIKSGLNDRFIVKVPPSYYN